jgi:LDH2 family malate/lactate/ureidoglycolate dehydrogenase
MRGSRRMPGVDRIWLPGEQSHAKRLHNEQHGITLPGALLTQLDEFARGLGVAPLSLRVG